jgi:hypothetical protein
VRRPGAERGYLRLSASIAVGVCLLVVVSYFGELSHAGGLDHNRFVTDSGANPWITLASDESAGCLENSTDTTTVLQGENNTETLESLQVIDSNACKSTARWGAALQVETESEGKWTLADLMLVNAVSVSTNNTFYNMSVTYTPIVGTSQSHSSSATFCCGDGGGTGGGSGGSGTGGNGGGSGGGGGAGGCSPPTYSTGSIHGISTWAISLNECLTADILGSIGAGAFAATIATAVLAGDAAPAAAVSTTVAELLGLTATLLWFLDASGGYQGVCVYGVDYQISGPVLPVWTYTVYFAIAVQANPPPSGY